MSETHKQPHSGEAQKHSNKSLIREGLNAYAGEEAVEKLSDVVASFLKPGSGGGGKPSGGKGH